MNTTEKTDAQENGGCRGQFGWDSVSAFINGERRFLISGEFHYFRVPKEAWRERLRLLKAAGGECVATYIPWILHEPEDGRILFDDCPMRDLSDFLRTVKEEGLMAIVRPGPYQYSELVYDGLPQWLIDGHPEIAKRHQDGRPVRLASVDYNHPYFLERTRLYFKSVADVIRPHMAENGGCIALVQLDNEMCGIHTWFGYNPTPEYFESCAEYLDRLRAFLAEFGICGPYCHNAGGAMMTQFYAKSVSKLGTKDFILGYDHYYNLGDSFGATHPTLDYFYSALFACDTLKAFGYPPLGFEIQAGTIGDFQPILKEDILACHMANLAAGMKGINYYVFTGGPNPPLLGNTVDIYDYSAPVAADGTLRPTYESLKTFAEFTRSHSELLEADRVSGVSIAFEWEHFARCAKSNLYFLQAGIFNALVRTKYHPEFLPLEGRPDPAKPLILAGITSMSEEAQRKVADFVLDGGKLLVAPSFPEEDNDGKKCTLLADALGAPAIMPEDDPRKLESQVCRASCGNIYGYKPAGRLESGDCERQTVLTSPDGASIYGCKWKKGKGEVVQLAVTGKAMFNNQADLLASLLSELGAQPVAESSNRNIILTAYRLKNGKTGIFALNLHASPQETTVRMPSGKNAAIALKAMEVGYIEL